MGNSIQITKYYDIEISRITLVQMLAMSYVFTPFYCFLLFYFFNNNFGNIDYI